MMPGAECPTISFVIATLNEETAIETCVRSLLDQHYPPELIEVRVVDGGSADRTREIVAAMAAADPRVRLLHNPARIAASAFNIGVASSTGGLVSLVSAHSSTDPEYAALLVDAFETSGAALVGGRMDAAAVVGDTPMAEAIARATSSPFGLGSARFHYSDRPGWVDTAFPGAYRRELFAEIGGFDESLVRNQDDDLHLRARLAGKPMWFDPRLRSTYRPRRTLAKLWSQYEQYGWWRAATIHKHGRVASMRHLAPAALVAGIAVGPLAAAAAACRRRIDPAAACRRRIDPAAACRRRIGPAAAAGRRRTGLALAWAGGVTAWSAVLTLAGWRERRADSEVIGRVPVAVACVHLAYGVGFWRWVGNRIGAAARRSGRQQS